MPPRTTMPRLAIADNGAMMENAQEVVTVPGRLPILKKRKEAETEAPAPGRSRRERGKVIRGDKERETAAEQGQGKNLQTERKGNA